MIRLITLVAFLLSLASMLTAASLCRDGIGQMDIIFLVIGPVLANEISRACWDDYITF